MTSRDPLSIQVDPPEVFDGRPWDECTVYELQNVLYEIQDRLCAGAEVEEREALERKESDVFRCLGQMCIYLAPPEGFLREWHQAMADAKAATPFSTESIDALTRQAEVERAIGADKEGFARDYLGGAEPIP